MTDLLRLLGYIVAFFAGMFTALIVYALIPVFTCWSRHPRGSTAVLKKWCPICLRERFV